MVHKHSRPESAEVAQAALLVEQRLLHQRDVTAVRTPWTSLPALLDEAFDEVLRVLL